MIGIIGAGNMGKAIAQGMGQRVLISDADPRKLRSARNRRCVAVRSNIDLTKRSNVVILAVKPRHILKVLKEIKPYVKSRLIISIAAGVETRRIEKMLGRARVIRVMPNMPLMAGKGISAVAKGRFSQKKDLAVAQRIFSKRGEVVRVKEDLMDAVTAVSGSGPAYYFLFTDLLEKAARACGLKKGLAEKLALATFIGAAASADAANISMQVLVKKVASKGGTTEAALKIFKQKGLERIIKQAVQAALKRSRCLKNALHFSPGLNGKAF